MTEFVKITNGLVPHSMDHRWFIFFEKGWLYFHRSWTGRCIFQVRLKIHKAGYQIVEGWSSRNPQQHRCADVAGEARIISILIDQQLLARRT